MALFVCELNFSTRNKSFLMAQGLFYAETSLSSRKTNVRNIMYRWISKMVSIKINLFLIYIFFVF